jgi:ribosomal protein S18 acetylase RimI-like enzyme
MIRLCGVEDVELCAKLAFDKNSRPETGSSYCYTKYDSIYNDFRSSVEEHSGLLVGCFDGGRLNGVLNLFIDSEKRTADCAGPFVGSGDFVSTAGQMIEFAKSKLAGPYKLNFFFDKRNAGCIALMEKLNAENEGNEFLLKILRTDFIGEKKDNNIKELESAYYDAFARLHNSIFPGAYVSGKDILTSIGKDRRVLCVTHGDTFTGYGVIKKAEGSKRAVIEVLGVDKAERGKGLGKALLLAMLRSVFDDPAADAADLVVEKVNENALGLYLSCGFKIEAENCSYCVK